MQTKHPWANIPIRHAPGATFSHGAAPFGDPHRHGQGDMPPADSVIDYDANTNNTSNLLEATFG